MAIQKNKSRKGSGKQKKSVSEMGTELREMIGNFLMENFVKFTQEVKKLEIKERVKVYCNLLPYLVPKFRSKEEENPFEHCTDAQLDYLLDELKKAP